MEKKTASKKRKEGVFSGVTLLISPYLIMVLYLIKDRIST